VALADSHKRDTREAYGSQRNLESDERRTEIAVDEGMNSKHRHVQRGGRRKGLHDPDRDPRASIATFGFVAQLTGECVTDSEGEFASVWKTTQ